MTESHLIRPVSSGKQAEPGISRSRPCAVPCDLLEEASRRLAVMSLVAAVLWLAASALNHLALRAMTNGDPSWAAFNVADAIASVCALASVGLFFYVRRSDRHPSFILDLGLVYMVLNCLALGLLRNWDPVIENAHLFPRITWIGAVVLMASAIVPNTPNKVLLAGVIAASMNPLSWMMAVSRGRPGYGPVSNALVMYYPDYLLVGVAVVISHVVTRLGQQVTKAREMGSYQLVKQLGSGGMGEVWRARHRMLARDAAIKLIQPGMLSRGSKADGMLMRRRFEQEAKATASLRSPHTVQLYDYGVTEEGIYYYVMELLDGIDLETLVKRFGPQPPARVMRILRQVCRSLADAHRHGMIHRDIKPANIFLCRMGNEYDFVKVLDFGLVKVMDGRGLGLTGDGVTTGTPAYIAPEVAMGRSDLDGRADLYALGCVGYLLLTGSLVFQESGAAAMMLAHVQKNPVPPSERSEFVVPVSLDQAIMGCLAKDPAERPARADVLERMLEGADGGGFWAREDAERWWHTYVPEGLADRDGDEDAGLVDRDPPAAA
ncbi:MAG: serine/threonine-protein kinase [Bryobacteraceae bacterium]